MSWEKREILLIAKTYPERSQKYGNTVCTAGIMEDTNEWVRVYPINLNVYLRKKLKKFVRFKAEIRKNKSEMIKRKESYKIREKSIKITDDSLVDPKVKGVWEERTKILEKSLSESMEFLKNQFEIKRMSLGIIKPHQKSIKFLIEKPVDNVEIDVIKEVQLNLFGEQVRKVDKIEHAFSYRYKCNIENCKGHKMICIDWELLESFRKWRKTYKTPQKLEFALINRYNDWMIKERDLYLVVGTIWRYKTWIIIGLFYPPKKGQKTQKKLSSFFKK